MSSENVDEVCIWDERRPHSMHIAAIQCFKVGIQHFSHGFLICGSGMDDARSKNCQAHLCLGPRRKPRYDAEDLHLQHIGQRTSERS